MYRVLIEDIIRDPNVIFKRGIVQKVIELKIRAKK